MKNRRSRGGPGARRDTDLESRTGGTDKSNAAAATLSSNQWWILGSTGLSLVILGIAALVSIAWIPSLPDQVAVHWNASMQADRFSAPASFIGLTFGLMAGIILLFASIGFVAKQSDVLARVMVGTQIFLSGMGGLLLLLTLGRQRGQGGGAGTSLPVWVPVLSVLVPAVIGFAVAALIPRRIVPDAPHGPGKKSPLVEVLDGIAPVWGGRTTMPTALLWIICALIVAVFAWFGATSGIWWWLMIAIPLAAVILLESGYTVRIDGRGIRARAWLGWPSTFISALQVQEARVVEVRPLQDFGGWGYRISLDGTQGVVLRKGSALHIEYGNSSVLVISLNQGAQDAAAALNAVATLARDADSQEGPTEQSE